MSVMKRILLLGTFDTKHPELGYVIDLLHGRLVGNNQKLVVDTLDISFGVVVARSDVTFPNTLLISEDESASLPSREERRARLTDRLPELVLRLFRTHHYAVVCGLGGSNGTSLFNLAIRDLPLMYPRKICLSTVAQGQTSSTDQQDITFIPSVCDLSGTLNPISRLALESLAGTVMGQAAFAKPLSQQLHNQQKKLVAISMFGNTTAGVTRAAELLQQRGIDSVIYHAVGSGGRALMKGVQEGLFSGVLDITTTEMADELCGGVFSAGPDRLKLSLLAPSPIPHLIVPGCIDMVNFFCLASVPRKYHEADPQRNLVQWNDMVTLMRTNVSENEELARIFWNSISTMKEHIRFCIPLHGFSELSLSRFSDPQADLAFVKTLESLLPSGFDRCHTFQFSINQPEFIDRIVELFIQDLQSAHPRLSQTEQTLSPPRFPRSVEGLDTPRERALSRLIQTLSTNTPIIGAGAGTGISAKFEEKGGADLIIIYNSGLFRMAGCGSLAGLLAFSDANKVVLQMAGQILSVVKEVPVIAGVNATDPFRQGTSLDHFLKKLKKLGFAGVQNFPTVGLIDGLFRENLEETGMGYDKEVAMIHRAHQLGLLTTPYVFDVDQAVKMTKAGADILVAHMGLTNSGSIGAKTTCFTLQECVEQIQAIAAAAWEIRPDIIVLFHGGPIASPDDVRYIFQHTRGLAGFYGASSMERLPVETAIVDQVKMFKTIPFKIFSSASSSI